MNKIIILSVILLMGVIPVYAADSPYANSLEELQNTDPQVYQDIKSLESQIMENPQGIYQLLQNQDVQDQIVHILQNQNVRNQIYNLIQDEGIRNQINSLLENPEIQNQINLLMQNEDLQNEVNQIINEI